MARYQLLSCHQQPDEADAAFDNDHIKSRFESFHRLLDFLLQFRNKLLLSIIVGEIEYNCRGRVFRTLF